MNVFSKQYCVAIRYLRMSYFYSRFAPAPEILDNAFQKILVDLVRVDVDKPQPIK